jgi:hypothetical protein
MRGATDYTHLQHHMITGSITSAIDVMGNLPWAQVTEAIQVKFGLETQVHTSYTSYIN